jgi:hypothetical protein
MRKAIVFWQSRLSLAVVMSANNNTLALATMQIEWHPSAQDLRDAPQSVVIENTVVRLKVFASEDHMPMAVPRDPKTGLPLPNPRKMHVGFRLISENGTPRLETLPIDRSTEPSENSRARSERGILAMLPVLYDASEGTRHWNTRLRWLSRRPQNASLPCPPNVGRIKAANSGTRTHWNVCHEAAVRGMR